MNKIEDGDEVEIVFDDTENPHGTENFTVEVRFGKGDDANKRTKQFNTKAELDAYLEGLSDMDGYSCFEIL